MTRSSKVVSVLILLSASCVLGFAQGGPPFLPDDSRPRLIADWLNRSCSL
jgi:hypothetical protein